MCNILLFVHKDQCLEDALDKQFAMKFWYFS